LYWTGFGFHANIVEEYCLLAAVMHVVVALKRTWDISLGYSISSGKLNLAISGVLLLAYMIIHLFQFRFGATQPYMVRPPPYMINLSELPHLFFTTDPAIPEVAVRDIYRLEVELFQDWTWVIYYLFSTCVFLAHYWWGWEKVVPSSQLSIPKKYVKYVTWIGWAVGVFVALCYISFPLYCKFIGPENGVTGKW